VSSLCASLHEFPALPSARPDTRQVEVRADLAPANVEARRIDFEAKISRAYQQLALKWLDGLLTRYEKVTAACGRNRITVQPLSPQGFAATLSIEGGRCKVLLGPCCEEFGSVAEATEYMTAAIRGDLRLRVNLDQRPHRWAVERRFSNGTWLDEAAVEADEHAGNSWYFRNQPEAEN
jgi:hypothetical protein